MSASGRIFRHFGESLGGAESLLEAVSLKKATKSMLLSVVQPRALSPDQGPELRGTTKDLMLELCT